MAKIKLNGKWVEVKEGDEVETTAAPAEETEADAEVVEQAKKIGKKVAEDVMASLKIGEANELSKKVDRLIDQQFGSDSKIKQILNGRSIDAEDLTANEKIILFFRGLVTNNNPVLKALAEGVDADGGYLFPNEFMSELLRDLPDINVMRQEVRIIPMKRDKMDVTNLVNPLGVFWTAENATKSTTTARFAQQTLTAFKMAAILYTSDELVEDSTEIDLVSTIITLFAEAIATEEEKVIWQGNGSTQPQGINTATVASVGGTGNTYNDITSLYYLLPSKYRTGAAFYCNSNTAKNIEMTKDTNGRPIFNAGTETIPATLKGKRLVISEWVPDRVLYFGDLKKGYFLGDRKRMTAKVSNDTETAFTKDQTAIRVVARIAGRLVWPAAVRKVTAF